MDFVPLIVLANVLLLFIILGAALWAKRAGFRRALKWSLRSKLLLVRMPREIPSEQTDFKEEINRSAQLFASLAGMKSPFVFEAAVPNFGEEIKFYVSVPREEAALVARQIEGTWPKAIVSEAEDYNIFNPNGKAVSAYVTQEENYVLPIRTFEEAGLDTFAPILAGLSKVAKEGEGVAIQIVADDAPKEAKKRVFSAIKKTRQGADFKEALGEAKSFMITPADVGRALGGTKDKEGKEKEKEKEPKVVDEKLAEALESKASKPLLWVNIRILASAPDEASANLLLQSIVGGFSQFSAPKRNGLKIIKERKIKPAVFDFSFRLFVPGKAMVLNTAELASIFHLPTTTTAVAKVAWVKSKEAAPPPELPDVGTVIGETNYRGEHNPVMLTDDDRRRHLYIIGQTGTGKSAFIKSLAARDIMSGKGIAIIDPHGDLADDVLSLVPKERLEDVIVFNPSDLARPLGMNMLEYDFSRPEEKTFIVNEMQGIFGKLFSAETMGPMFEQYMRNALLLLMDDMPNEPATLIEVARVFTDEEYRNRKLSRATNPVVIDFWEKEATKVTGEASIANMAPYITSKFNTFTANDYIRPIIGQTTSAFNFRKAMDEGKIILVNLSKGKIGDINANLLGMIVVGKILMAALSRVDLPESERKDFYLYIDEFQNFTTDSIATILSEARKYKLSLTVAHQFIAQLSDKIRDAVFGNVGSIVSFRVGMTDAEQLEKQFSPVFAKEDLANIDNFNAYVRLLSRGQPTRPFNIRTLPPPKGSREWGEQLKTYAAMKYGRLRMEVEDEIISRLRR